MKKKEREAIEDALREEELAEARKRTISKFFVAFSKQHVAFLKELVSKYKEAGDFPLMPMTILPSYYTDIEDREIAVFASLLIKDDGNFDRINAFRKILTDHPFEWFRERGFVRLSLGSTQNKRTGGVENWKIAKLFDRLWEMCHVTTQTAPNGMTVSFVRPIGFQVELMVKAHHCSFFDMLTYILEDCFVGEYFYRIRLLQVILGRSDGFSLNLWKIPLQDIKCPVTSEIKGFLKTWFPNYSLAGGIDYAIDLFGFNSAGDFYYAFLAWKRLCGKDPKGCSRYATIYQKWYSEGNIQMPHKWKLVQPNFI